MADLRHVELAADELETAAKELVNALYMNAPEAEEIRPVWNRTQEAYVAYIRALEEYEERS